MGWQKKSYGSRHESSSGYAFIISGIPKGFIGTIVYSKACQRFDAGDNRGEEVEIYGHQKNFQGISKSMEANAILKMVGDKFRHRCFIIGVIVSEYNRTI